MVIISALHFGTCHQNFIQLLAFKHQARSSTPTSDRSLLCLISSTWFKNCVLPQSQRSTHFHCQMIKATGPWSCKSENKKKIQMKKSLSSTYLLWFSISRMVSSYLVHHGYSATAEKFSEITGQSFTEDIVSIKTRQSKLFTPLLKVESNVFTYFRNSQASTNGTNWTGDRTNN